MSRRESIMPKMELSSSYVGTKLRPLSVTLTLRQTMNFAAGILDDSECYFDDLRSEGIVAHPMQVCSLTWQLSSRFSDYLLADSFPAQLSSRQVHYTQTIHWHLAMRPGDELTIDGRITAILPHRSGTHMVVEYQARNSDNQLVFTEYTGALFRGVQCADAGQRIETAFSDFSMPDPPYNPTTTIWEHDLELHPLSAHIYDGCADIAFPIHSSPAFAKSVGLPNIIMQGTATVAFAISELIRREANGNPWLITRLDCRFTGMVFPGTTIFIRLHERQSTTQGHCLYWSVVDNQGGVVVADGRLAIMNDR